MCLSISLETDKLLDYCNSVLAGILLHFARRLQSVMNAAVIKVRSLYAAPIRQLHCMAKSSMADRLPADRSGLQKNGLTPSYLADELYYPAESKFRRRLRSASSHELSVPRTRPSTYGDRAFPVAAVRIWNSLPQHITSAPSLPVFCSRLKTYFFELCYP